MKYTQIPTDAFKKVQLNAGIIVDSFTVATKVIGNIIGATSGGISFEAVPEYKDFGDGIDNCPKNTKELKKLDSWTASMSGSFVTVDSALIKSLVGAGDAASGKITPRADLTADDFDDVWWIGDYSDINVDGSTAGKAGYIAIHLINALNVGGFKLQSADKDKGVFAFNYQAHYSLDTPSTVPFEIYVAAGTTT